MYSWYVLTLAHGLVGIRIKTFANETYRPHMIPLEQRRSGIFYMGVLYVRVYEKFKSEYLFSCALLLKKIITIISVRLYNV